MSDENLIFDTKRKIVTKYPRFASELSNANIQYASNLKYHTAATDGKCIYVDPNYFESLSDDDRMFLIAHELLHIKFMHMYRLKDKLGKPRDMRLWNIATDAIINANLERDGFKIKEGYINRPEALNYSAEEFYEILVKEEEKKKQQNQNGNGNGDGQGKGDNGQDGQGDEEQEGQESGDDHTMWKEAFKENEDQKKSSKKSKKDKSNDGKENGEGEDFKENESDSDEKKDSDGSEGKINRKKGKTDKEIDDEFNEKEEFKKNREEKIKKFKEKRAQTNQKLREEKLVDGIGRSAEEIDWRLLLKKSISKEEIKWSQRRSIKENNYAYRLEEMEEDDAMTEVMIDISGSVDEDLVRAFLRQLKPILKESKLKVGCFNELFWGFKEIKTLKDIDNFEIDSEADEYGGTDLDVPVRAFTKSKEINKIIFTDGYVFDDSKMPKSDLRNENVIWLVYGNKKFRPCCGKVINITEKQVMEMRQIYYNICHNNPNINQIEDEEEK